MYSSSPSNFVNCSFVSAIPSSTPVFSSFAPLFNVLIPSLTCFELELNVCNPVVNELLPSFSFTPPCCNCVTPPDNCFSPVAFVFKVCIPLFICFEPLVNVAPATAGSFAVPLFLALL